MLVSLHSQVLLLQSDLVYYDQWEAGHWHYTANSWLQHSKWWLANRSLCFCSVGGNSLTFWHDTKWNCKKFKQKMKCDTELDRRTQKQNSKVKWKALYIIHGKYIYKCIHLIISVKCNYKLAHVIFILELFANISHTCLLIIFTNIWLITSYNVLNASTT